MTSQFYLIKLVKDVLTSLSFHEDYKELYFKVLIGEEIKLETDYSLLRFVMINLLDNAIKFRNKEGGLKKEVLIEAVLLENSFVLQVKDFGIGVDEVEIPYLFDMFSKAAGKFQTAGLGLYMSKLCIEKLHGELTVIILATLLFFKLNFLPAF